MAWASSPFNTTFSLVWPLRQGSLDIDLGWTEETFSFFYAVLRNFKRKILHPANTFTYYKSNVLHKKLSLAAETKLSLCDRNMPKSWPQYTTRWYTVLFFPEIKPFLKKAEQCDCKAPQVNAAIPVEVCDLTGASTSPVVSCSSLNYSAKYQKWKYCSF